MKNKIIIIILFTLFTGFAFGQDLQFPDMKGFRKITTYPVYLPENLWDFIDGAADAYLALGFQDLHVAEYKKGKAVKNFRLHNRQ